MGPLTWRRFTSKDRIYQPQEPQVFRDCSHFELSPSPLEYVIVLFWLHCLLTRKTTKVINALFKWSYLALKEGDVAYEQQHMTLLKVEQFHLSAATILILVDSSFLDQVREALVMDYLILDIKQHPSKNQKQFKFVNDLLYFEEGLYVLEELVRFCVLQAQHNFLATRHFGFYKKLEFISWDFRCCQMAKALKEFVFSCDICRRSKYLQHCPCRLLLLLTPLKQLYLLSL